MSSERRKVLEMLFEGKITTDEAERLLHALGKATAADAGGDAEGERSPDPDPDPDPPQGWGQFEGIFSEMKDALGDGDIKAAVARAGHAVRVSMPRLRRVIEEADEATSSFPDIGRALEGMSSALEGMGRKAGAEFRNWSAGMGDDCTYPEICERDLDESHPMDPGSTLRLANPRGSIEVRSWDRSEVGVHLHVTSRARTEAAARARAEAVVLESESAAGSLLLRPAFAGVDAGGVAGDGRVALGFRLTVPRTANLDLDNQHGALQVEAVDGDATLVNRHGPTTTDLIGGALSIDQAHGPVRVLHSGADLKLKCAHAGADVDGVGGSATVHCSHGPVRLENIARDTAAQCSHSGLKARMIGGDCTVRISHGAVKLASVKGSVTLNASHGSAKVDDVEGDLRAKHSHGALKVKHVAGNLVARNSHGTIVAEEVGQNATLKNSHGSVHVAGVGAEATVHGDRGRLVVERVGGRVAVRSSRSPIAVTDAGGEVLVHNEGGDIVLTSNTPIRAAYTVANRRGNVRIHLPVSSAVDINGYVRRGHIESDLPLQITANGEHGQTVSGQLGEGSAPMQIDIERGHLSLNSLEPDLR